MKEKIRNLLLIVFAFLMILLPQYHPQADSGFDGSYDSGSSSSWSSSSSSDYSWSSSSSTSSGSSSPASVFMTLIFLIVFIIILADKLKNVDLINQSTMPTTTPYDLNKLKEILPDFTEEEFKNKTYEIYTNIQTAWMNFDNDTIQKLVTDELYSMYKSQLTTLKVKKQTNIMKNFSLLDFKIVGMDINNKTISLSVNMKVECYDYIIDSTNKTVRGNDKHKVTYNYFMTFNKGISNKSNKCPNCNAPLDNVNSSKCPYCDSNIINENYDWVLSKKQVISQTVNKKR